MRPKIFSQSWDDYCALNAVSRSELDWLLVSPQHFLQRRDRERKPKSKCLRVGDALHHYILDPDDFSKQTVIRPERFKDYKSKAAKKWKNEQEQAGKNVVSPDEWANVMRMSERIRSHSKSGPLLSRGRAEQTVLRIHEETKIVTKSRVDFIPDKSLFIGNNRAILDIKTTQLGKLNKFAGSIKKYGYHRQAASYMAAVNACGEDYNSFLWVVIESEWPNGIRVFQLDESGMAQGLAEYEELLRKLRECLDADEWPGESEEIEMISLNT